MMIFRKHKERRDAILSFADLAVSKFSRAYPPHVFQSEKISTTRLTRIVESILDDSAKFKIEQRLGFLDKAKLGHSVKWKMIEQGYEEQVIDFLVEAIIVKLSLSR